MVVTIDLPERWRRQYGVAVSPVRLWKAVRGGIVPIERRHGRLYIAESDVPRLEQALGLSDRASTGTATAA